jgi:hypothetical protein
MVGMVLERKNRDFFRQVTLVVETQVTSKFEANWQFQVPSRIIIGGRDLLDYHISSIFSFCV